LTDSQYQSTSQSSDEEPVEESSGGVPAVEQKKDGEPAEVETEEKQEEEGLTFNEWTQKVLAEAEKGKLEGIVSGYFLSTLIIHGGPLWMNG
jgi:hypothetical protein